MKTSFLRLFFALLRCSFLALCLGVWSGCGGDDDDNDNPHEGVPDAFHPDPNATDESEDENEDNSSTGTNAPPATTTNAPSSGGGDNSLSKVNLTGNWKRLTAVYKLKHSGASLQGSYVDGVNSNVSGKIAGSVSGVFVEMDVIVHYADNPTNDFTAHKSGKITGQNSMRLVVTASPHYQGQVQDWYR